MKNIILFIILVVIFSAAYYSIDKRVKAADTIMPAIYLNPYKRCTPVEKLDDGDHIWECKK